jgi:glycosyltransferase involved in cell wall biosynthesis
MRAPVGGLFRHVCDLATEQTALGHAVAVVCADTGDALTSARLDALGKVVSLGVHRVKMGRDVGLSDVTATRVVYHTARQLDVDIVHGHGAKGGGYARFAAFGFSLMRARKLCFYTPHGGSLHYAPTSLKGRAFMSAERQFQRVTDGLIFESAYSAARFGAQVGAPTCASRTIPNGVLPQDFEPIGLDVDATDLLFIGELRQLKGVDVMLDALALVNRRRRVTATVVGGGPDAEQFRVQAAALGLDQLVRFPGALPAPQAFKMGRTLIMPSRAESFPYVVLEAGAVGKPIIATRVGGIPEIAGDTGTPLIAPGDPEALAAALFETLEAPESLQAAASALRMRVAELFTVAAMTRSVMDFYAAAQGLGAPVKPTPRRLSLLG